METINHKSQYSAIHQKECCIADEIFRNLNQGSLYDIYQIIEKLNGLEEEQDLEQIFLERYHFDFREYI